MIADRHTTTQTGKNKTEASRQNKHQTNSDTELEKVINKLPQNKAPGLDHITNKAIQKAPKKTKMTLLTIINTVLRLSYYPERWKNTVIIFIPKTDHHSQFPQDYRPISLLPTMAKITEKINTEIKRLHLLPHEQFGFRPEHSCELQVARLVEYITEGFSQKQSTAAVFLDISKAFDKVWHNGPIFKLNQQNLPLKIT